jgi:hypothetical protein
MRSSSWCSGLMPRASASHTSSTASGRMTNCGSITPLMISVASTLRFSRVSATCTRAGLAGQRHAHPDVGHAQSMPVFGIAQRTSPAAGGSSGGGGGRSRSPARIRPWAQHLVVHVSDSSARRISLADCGRLNCTGRAAR